MARSSNILEEYLVALGFQLDQVGFSRFQSMLREASSLVDANYLRMGAAVIKFEGAAVSAFAALGAGILTFAERTAMADQEYRLLALRMYTSLPVARELKIALDALGQPLENVIWDPELAARFAQLIRDQQTMTKELGPDFEAQMLKIRDVRFEFTRLGVEIKYLTMLVVQDLAKAFGTDLEGLLQRLRNFNEYLIQNMPAIAQWIATTLKPVLIDVKDIMATLWELVKQLVVDFTNLVAVISGNKSLATQTADLKKFADALKVTVEGLAHLTMGILKVGTNLSLLFDAAVQAAHGNYKGALGDLTKMKPILGGGEATAPAGGLVGAGPAMATKENIQQAIIAQANALGVPPELALAVAKIESDFRQYGPSGKILMPNDPNSHAMGIFQLQPKTAKQMGVDPTDVGGNILGGVKYLKMLMDMDVGNVQQVLEDYYGSKDVAKNKAYASKVLGAEAGIHIENLTVTVHGPGDPHAIKQAVKDGISEAERQRIQRNLAELTFPVWSY